MKPSLVAGSGEVGLVATGALAGPLNHSLSREYGTCKTSGPAVLVRVFGDWSLTDLQTIPFLRNAAMRPGMRGMQREAALPQRMRA